MIRTAALCAALVALAACDAGAPDDDLVGTWTFASLSSEQIATLSRSQSVVDMSLPPTGEIGAEARGVPDRFTFVNGYYRYGGTSTLFLGTYDSNAPTYPIRRGSLSLYEDGAGYRIDYAVEDVATTGYTYESYSGEATGRIRSGVTYDIGRIPLTSGDGSAATVAGQFTLGHRVFEANRPTALSGYRYDFTEGPSLRYVFEADGTLRVQEVRGSLTTEQLGSWSRTGDRVTISVTSEGQTFSVANIAVVSGAALTLTADTGDTCGRDCRQMVEDQFGIEPGTLTAIRSQDVLHLVRTATAGASVRAEPRGPGLPRILRERLGLSPSAG